MARHGTSCSARRTRAALVVGLVGLAVGLIGPAGVGARADQPEARVAPVAPFTGTVEEFYVVPDPLPPGEPGSLIRVQDVGSADGAVTKRIMYHSRDADGRDRAVTGIVTYPDAPAPPDGWPVLATANGTVGQSSRCALSRNGWPASTYGVTGVGVATDYIGLGPVGEVHPYLSRPSEAHSVIDAVRAVRHLPDAQAGRRWLVVGHSQGGHAAIATNELAATYGPELHLLGTVAQAPGAVFDKTYGPIDELVAHVITFMMFQGAATEHPEIVLDDYLGPGAAGATHAVRTGCLPEIIGAVLTVPRDQLYANDPALTEPARSILLGNDVGFVAAPSPLLVQVGTADGTVVIDRARDLFDRLCQTGQVTEYTEYVGADHGSVIGRAEPEARAWIAERFAGQPEASDCPGWTPPPPPPPPAPPPAPPPPSPLPPRPLPPTSSSTAPTHSSAAATDRPATAVSGPGASPAVATVVQPAGVARPQRGAPAFTG